MRKYKSFLSKFLLLEAIPLSDIKKMIKGWDKNRHADWFDNKFRVYLPLEKSIPKEELKSPVETDIETKLSNEGYEIENYKDGIVINKKQGNRKEKIGKVLNKIDKDLLKRYNEDPSRSGAKSSDKQPIVVISRHPYDIAGMSTDRGWSSCKNLGTKKIYGKHENTVGSNSKYIQDEVFNLLIAYLIKPEDRNIKNPIARINLIPYLNNKGQVGYIIDRGGDKYGFSGVLAKVFVDTTQKWLDSKQGKLLGKYVINPFVYRDTLEKEYNLRDTFQLPDWVERSGNIPKDFSYDNLYSDAFIWKVGTWRNGVWKDGVWEGGAWENGIWETGIWETGIWEYGNWKAGTWKNGTWEGGAWEGGVWKDGIWKNGIWETGIWEYGTWRNGIWKNGTWEYGIWETGNWKAGTWKNGTWEYGIWMGGIWMGGIWQSGWILDKEKKGNFKPEWEWNGVYVVSPISPKEYFEKN